ncbi:hypothetical protein B296_00008128 [Ensete ventricosum]|uniref:Malectin-like domain-containing protein n=1 Tax=Ensete ventricosum TaxID=4639 RepID=A0A426ZVC6_ENSVE|nr:hypothetical protein B296_00008128 [Ensete ventricosum]
MCRTLSHHLGEGTKIWRCAAEEMLDRFLLLFAMSLMLAPVNSQQPSTAVKIILNGAQIELSSFAGFISIDCGNANSKYLDPITKMSYVSDDQFIDAGSNFDISPEYINSTVPVKELNLRSFPEGLRNCYRLKNVSQNRAYLVRATFMYGNYDGKNSSPTKFDLHIGVNHWKTIVVSDPSAIYTVEALSYATANLTSVCLINTGSGTPFISSLEMRPLKEGYYGEYVNASQSVVLVTRRNMGASDTVRFPDDPYDRVWNPSDDPSWVTLSTDLKVDDADNLFAPPIIVLQTAVTPATGRQLDFSCDAGSPDENLYHVLYFTELRLLTGNATRAFNITRNGDTRFSWYTPPYLSCGYIYSAEPFDGYSRYRYVLDATSNSTLPPIINAFEVYSLMQLTEAATDSVDGKTSRHYLSPSSN